MNSMPVRTLIRIPVRILHAVASGMLVAFVTTSAFVTGGLGQEVENGEMIRQPEPTSPLSTSIKAGPVETELIALLRTPFATPEAKQRSIREWHQSRGAALKAELDARREAERPERERLEAENQAQHEKFLDAEVANGKIGSKEAQFIKLMRKPYPSAEHRSAAIKAWRELHGAAMNAERAQRRAAEAPQVAALQADVLAQRRQQIGEALQHGRIGPREAELMRLHFDLSMEPAARQQAIRTWMAAHEGELQAEQDARRQRDLAELPTEATPAP